MMMLLEGFLITLSFLLTRPRLMMMAKRRRTRLKRGPFGRISIRIPPPPLGGRGRFRTQIPTTVEREGGGGGGGRMMRGWMPPPLMVLVLSLLLQPSEIFLCCAFLMMLLIPLPERLRGGGGRGFVPVLPDTPSLPQTEIRIGLRHVQVMQHEMMAAVRSGHRSFLFSRRSLSFEVEQC